MGDAEKLAAFQRQQKEQEKQEQEMRVRVDDLLAKAASQVVLNIGGTEFTTSTVTLKSIKSIFNASLNTGKWKLDSQGRYFVDRDPELFIIILNYLRTGKLKKNLEPSVIDQLQEELDFYMIEIPELRKSEWMIEAKWVDLVKDTDDRGSAAEMAAILGKPPADVLSGGWSYLGQIACTGKSLNGKALVVRATASSAKAIRSVSQWDKLWQFRKFSIWRGVTDSDDYKVLGDYWRGAVDDPEAMPKDDKIVAVHKNLLLPSSCIPDATCIWCDRKSNAPKKISIHGYKSDNGIYPGTFVTCEDAWTPPTNREVFCLNPIFVHFVKE